MLRFNFYMMVVVVVCYDSCALATSHTRVVTSSFPRTQGICVYDQLLNYNSHLRMLEKPFLLSWIDSRYQMVEYILDIRLIGFKNTISHSSQHSRHRLSPIQPSYGNKNTENFRMLHFVTRVKLVYWLNINLVRLIRSVGKVALSVKLISENHSYSMTTIL